MSLKTLSKVLSCGIFFIFGTLLFLRPLPAQAVGSTFTSWQGYAEYINDFDSVIQVQQNGDLLVSETIKVTTLSNYSIIHGIYRDFPTLYPDGLFYKQVDFSVISATMDGQPVPFSTAPMNNGTRVYLGNENRELAPGVYTYVLNYRTNQQLGFFENYDELYFNINGNGWAFPIIRSSASIELPGTITADLTAEAYTGLQGERGRDYESSVTQSNGKTIAHYNTTASLMPGAGMTVVVDFPKGIVNPPGVFTDLFNFTKANWYTFTGIFAVLWAIAASLIYWWFKGRDPKKGTVIPLFEPPQIPQTKEQLSPAQLRYLYKMDFDNKALAAAIINMAVKGKLNIAENKGVYSLSKKEDASKRELTAEEQVYFNSIFASLNKSITLNREEALTLSTAFKNFQKNLEKWNKENKLVHKGLWPWILICFGFYFLYLLALILTFALLNNESYILLFVSSAWDMFLVTFVVMTFKKGWGQFQAANKFFTCLTIIGSIAGLIFLGAIGFGMHYAAIANDVNPLNALLQSVMVLLPLLILLLMYFAMKRRSETGRKLTDQILGFRMFLNTADRERIRKLIPELPLGIGTDKANLDTSITRLKLFEYYLPYAVALDVEKQWSAKFAADLAVDPATNGQYLTWYSGTSVWHAAAFASGFSSGLSGSIASSATPPGSSGGGGGGFSGGGGGGGGGGGW